MSKIADRGLAAALVLSLFAPLGALAQAPAAPAGVKAATASSAGAVAASETLGASEAILKDVSRMRGLAILRPVPSGMKSRSDIEALVLKDLSDSSSERELADGTAMLRFLGLVPADFDLRSATRALLTEQIAGFYEPKTRFFYLADWIPLGQQREVIAHELTHALADQHFDLRRLEKWKDGDGDAKLAAHALVEGEATAVMLEFSLGEKGVHANVGEIPISLTEVLKSSVAEPDKEHPVFTNAPDVLKQSLQFPYVYGVGFIQAVVRDRGWKGVDAAYAALPASTEQIMHPSKYLAREMPVQVTLPDLSAALGAGWRRADQDVDGEFGYYLILKSALDDDRAARAAAGWAGDRYGFYRNDAANRSTFVHRSVWDSDHEADEFFDAYSARIAKRYSLAGAPPSDPAAREWSTPDGLVRAERRGREVVVVEGFRGASVAPLFDALWKGEVR